MSLALLSVKRFSLRTLLIVTAMFAVFVATPLRRAAIQKRGREWVAAQNGQVMFSYKYDPIADQWNHDERLRVPEWVVSLCGIDLFDSVDTVVLDNTLVTDLSPITDLQTLRNLAIVIEIAEDLDFSPLAKLPRLQRLHLDYTNISAERLAELRALLPNVRVDATNHPPPERSQ